VYGGMWVGKVDRVNDQDRHRRGFVERDERYRGMRRRPSSGTLVSRRQPRSHEASTKVKKEIGMRNEEENPLFRRIIRPLSFLSIPMPDVVFIFFIKLIISHGSTIHSSPKDNSFI
jgi:hypothetical protein